MATITECHHCHRRFSVDDGELAHAVRCQFCGRLFMAIEAEPEAAPGSGRAAAGVPENLYPEQMASIEAGGFLQGASSGAFYDQPTRRTRISHGFRMSRRPVTQREYFCIMLSNPSYFVDGDLPVENVTWHEAMAFCCKLTEIFRTAGDLAHDVAFRLPTEAEWEYACRTAPDATNSSHAFDPLPAYWWGNDPDRLAHHAWFQANSSERTRKVGQKQANPRGLYDMLGNVSEWCLDWFGPYTAGEVSDPLGLEAGDKKTRRGGSWGSIALRCRGADRTGVDPGCRSALLGFRIVLGPDIGHALPETKLLSV